MFPPSGGMLGGSGETEVVEVVNYHAPMQDFMSVDSHIPHCEATDALPRVELPLEVSPGFKYAFDPGDTWFRVGRGGFLHLAGRRIPVRLVTIDYEGFSDSWIYRDERDSEAA
jgi:hypothetical protein